MTEQTQPSKPPAKEQAQSKKAKAPRKKRPRWQHILLRTLRHLLVPVLCVIALAAGVAVGYVKLGGQPLADVWKMETWKHLIDLVFSNT